MTSFGEEDAYGASWLLAVPDLRVVQLQWLARLLNCKHEGVEGSSLGIEKETTNTDSPVRLDVKRPGLGNSTNHCQKTQPASLPIME